MRPFLLPALVVTAMAVARVASASPITIYGTGVADNGATLPVGAADSHWTVEYLGCPLPTGPSVGCSTPIPGTDATVLGPDSAFPFNVWAPNSTSTASQWIGPGFYADGNGNATNDVGRYRYETTFDLTGITSAWNVSISGRWLSDNGSELWLNGSQTSFNYPYDINNPADTFQTWNTFTLTSGFNYGGLNTLVFFVDNHLQSGAPLNLANPTGLRVEVTGDMVPVPEPGTLLLLGPGIALLANAVRRRRRA